MFFLRGSYERMLQRKYVRMMSRRLRACAADRRVVKHRPYVHQQRKTPAVPAGFF